MKHLAEIPPGNIAGFDLCGWEQKCGCVMNHITGKLIPAFPNEIEFRGNVYTKEETTRGQTTEKGTWINVIYA